VQRPLAIRLRAFGDRVARRMSAPTLKIGVSARILHPQPGAAGLQSKTLQYLEQTAAHWVMSRDVLVLMVPTVDKDGLLHRSNIRLADYARHLDGLVLQGGADVSPSSYGEEPLRAEWAGDRLRDEYEMELLHEFVEAGKPVLGICRGAQLINIAFGGTLYQDIATQVPQALKHDYFPTANAYMRDLLVHEVATRPDSRLARIMGADSTPVNSMHHQGIKDLAPGLVPSAFAPDGLIEGVEGSNGHFLIGVQWHPEELAATQAPQRRLFAAFIEAASR